MNPYAYLIAGVVALVMLAGAYIKGGNDREAKVIAAYQARDLKAATDYAAKEREITEAYRKKESQLAQSFATTGTKLQQERLKHAATKKDLDAALAAGSLVFTDPGNREACGDSATKAAASAKRNIDNAEAGLQAAPAGMVLSKQTAQWLIDIADEADAAIIQLIACQQILIDERK
jgi:hypothetical protein